jgi:phage gp36-like protein
MYATASALRARYRQGLDGVDEFAHREDADLEAALTAASAEIDRWRPEGAIGAAAAAVLSDVCVTLARLLAHQDQALAAEHPIVREAREARAWLKALAEGRVRLPAESASSDSGATWDATPTVWGRGTGGGL